MIVVRYRSSPSESRFCFEGVSRCEWTEDEWTDLDVQSLDLVLSVFLDDFVADNERLEFGRANSIHRETAEMVSDSS